MGDAMGNETSEGPHTGGGAGSGPAGERLAAGMERLLQAANGHSMTLGAMQECLGERGFGLLILVLALPFSSPVTIPGLSVPFGIVILWMSLRFALGRPPRVPGFLGRRAVSHPVLKTLVGLAGGLSRRLDRVVKKRFPAVFRGRAMRAALGLCLASGGFLLCLPFPPVIPFSNTVPAIGVVLVCAGLLEEDGLLVLVGAGVSVAAWGYLGWMTWTVGGFLHRFLDWLGWMS